jgi:hypothetical protein
MSVASLGGRELIDKAESVLRDAGEPLHYREISARLDTIGVKPRGVEPDATLLTALTRSPAIRGVGRRSGRYYLVGCADPEAEVRELRRQLEQVEAALERVLTWQLPNGTVEEWALPSWLRDEARAALPEQSEEEAHG